MSRFSIVSEYEYHVSSLALLPSDMYAWEALSFQGSFVRSYAAMEAAGQSIAKYLLRLYPQLRRAIILCGVGNNGGDAYVVARYFHSAGIELSIFSIGDRNEMRAECREAASRLANYEIPVYFIEDALGVEVFGESLSKLPEAIVIDGIFGTGIRREIAGLEREVIERLNASKLCVATIDLPSGLCARTGRILGVGVRARHCLSLGAAKLGALINEGPAYCGEIVTLDIGLGPLPLEVTRIELLSSSWCKRLGLGVRALDLHKGNFGHILCVGGSQGMTGALKLCSQAALRAGSALVTAVFADLVPDLRAECMSMSLNGAASNPSYESLQRRAGVLACGPGLGRGAQGRAVVEGALKFQGHLILDADALWILGQLSMPEFRGKSLVLTPHMGEAAVLLKKSVEEIQSDPLAFALEIARKYHAFVVLKSHTTLLAAENGDFALSASPNPALVGPGFGDVLTGMIAAQLSSLEIDRLEIFEAIALGIYRHARAGKKGAAQRGKSLLAGELIEAIDDDF